MTNYKMDRLTFVNCFKIWTDLLAEACLFGTVNFGPF